MIVLKDCLVFGSVQAVSFHGVIQLSNDFLGSFQICWVSSLADYQEKLIYLSNKPGTLAEGEGALWKRFLHLQWKRDSSGSLSGALNCGMCLMLGVLEVKVEGYWQELWKILRARQWQYGESIPSLNQSWVICHQLPFSSYLWAEAEGPLASSWKREGVQVHRIRPGHAGERLDPWLLMSFLVWEKVKLNFTSYLTWTYCK